MKTRKIIYAIMGVALFIATSCSKDSISDQNPATNNANSETTFLENIESESSSKNGIVFPDQVATKNQEFIDFLEGDWRITRFTIPEKEGKKSWINSIGHFSIIEGKIIASINKCTGSSNGYDIYFEVGSLKKIGLNDVRGVLKGTGGPIKGGFRAHNRSLGCNTDAFALADGFGYSLTRFGNVEKTESRDVAISIENNLLVVGDFSKNEIIVFKKME
ncbi:hypothetical protein [Aquimarina longa]|uniref:hypothetical protein n=1 Tax=Aquimarina longa TaxID=1080221 RepID=UPI00078190F6|nr:hypothetical protein [Aquimarina longa]